MKNHDQATEKKKKKMAEIPKNAKYTSLEIQNDVLQILVAIISKKIVEEVKESGEFSLIWMKQRLFQKRNRFPL